jgi:peptidoglycan/LPS O-acetylase OafA/YrhL
MTVRERISDLRLPALDGVRGIAVLGPLVQRFNLGSFHDGAAALAFALSAAQGWMGVVLFFVLSGFLITGILLDTKGAAGYFGNFYARRALRILPLYYTILFVAFVVLPLWHAYAQQQAVQWPGPPQIWFWLFLSNWWQAFGGTIYDFPHFWSLAVEEQFYLLWPLAVAGLALRPLVALCIGLIVIAWASRTTLGVLGWDSEAIYVLTMDRMDALAVGALVAIAMRSPAARAWLRSHFRQLVIGVLVVLALTAAVTHGFSRTRLTGQSIGYLALALGFGVLVLGAALGDVTSADGRLMRLLRSRFLRTLGKYSYGMYVLHPAVDLVLRPLVGRWIRPDETAPLAVAMPYMLVACIVTFGVAFVSFHLLEKPFLALKSRWRD